MTPLLSFAMHPLAQALGWTLIHFLWQGAALGLLAWLVLLLMRGGSAKARYGLACAFLVVMVAAPVATFLTLQPRAPALAGTVALDLAAASPAAIATPLAQRVKATLDPSLPWLLAGWAAGVLLLSTRFLGGWIRVQRLRRRSASPVPAEWHLVLSRLCRELRLSRTVRLLQSAAVEVPTALGWLRPIVLLPACALTGLAPMQLEAILAHELAHIRRGDFLVNLLQSLVEVLLFYHPAVWWLSARIRAERELCCDDVAATLCGDPLLLARALTDLEALREPLTPAPTHLALAANGGSLMHRIRHLLHPALPITSGARATALALLAASLLGAGGMALQDKGADAPANPRQTTRIKVSDGQRKLDVILKGEVQLNGEAPEPVTIPGEGSFRVEEKKPGKVRAYAATKAKSVYTVNGQEQPLDKEGRDWVRAIVAETRKAQSAKRQTQEIEVKTRILRDQAYQIEVETHMLEGKAHQMDRQAKDLERKGKHLSAEDRARIKAKSAKARAEAKKIRVEVIQQKGEAPRTIVFKGDDAAGDHVEILTENIQPDSVVIHKKVNGQDVIEKRMIVKKGGDPDNLVVHIEEDGKGMVEKRMKVIRKGSSEEGATWAFIGKDPDPQEEIKALQAAMKSLQTRLDQLQQQMAHPPKEPKPPKGPPAPKPFPAPPPAPDAPPAPPAPPVLPPPPPVPPPAPPSEPGR